MAFLVFSRLSSLIRVKKTSRKERKSMRSPLSCWSGFCPLRGPCGGAVCGEQLLVGLPGGAAAEAVAKAKYLCGAQ